MVWGRNKKLLTKYLPVNISTSLNVPFEKIGQTVVLDNVSNHQIQYLPSNLNLQTMSNVHMLVWLCDKT